MSLLLNRVPHFSPEAALALPGPSWLVERRRQAATAFAAAVLPNEGDEDWRYGRIDDLDLARFVPAAPRPGTEDGALPEAAARLLGHLGEHSGLVIARDGVVVARELDARVQAAGVVLDALVAREAAPEGFGERLGEQRDAFGLLAESFVRDGAVIEVPPAVRVPHPIVVVHWCTPASEGGALFPRTFVRVGPGAEATVVELLVSGDESCLVVPVVEVDVADGAHATVLGTQELGPRAWHLGYRADRVGRQATLRSLVAAFGGAYARHWSRSTLVGEGGEAQQLAVYLADGAQVEEFRTFQEHVAARTRSDLLFKGAVSGSARSVYTGLVRMHKGARRADASQANRNLVLSPDAQAFSVPNLDIGENDVRCSHASAVGPISPEERFYVESRGVPSAVAERLILLGFFEDLLGRCPHLGFAAHLRATVSGRLVNTTGNGAWS